jgi:hypothetical protein
MGWLSSLHQGEGTGQEEMGNCLNFVLGLLFSALHFFAFFLAKHPQAGLSSISSSSDPYH